MREPTVAQLVEEFGMTRQAYYEMKKVGPDRFQIYCDAWKYRMIIEDIAKIERLKESKDQ